MTADFVTAYRSDTGEPARVPSRWVDNPAIFKGRYVSQPPAPKTSRAKREPVEHTDADAAPDTSELAEAGTFPEENS